MSATTHGLSTVVFGTPSLTGFVIQDYSLSTKANVVAEVFDENGIRVHSRYDDVTKEVTVSAVFAGASLPSPGAVFTYDSVSYEVVSVDQKRSNKGFQEVTIKGKTSAGVSLP